MRTNSVTRFRVKVRPSWLWGPVKMVPSISLLYACDSPRSSVMGWEGHKYWSKIDYWLEMSMTVFHGLKKNVTRGRTVTAWLVVEHGEL